MTSTLTYLGTFEGFNFRTQSAIMRRLTAEDVVNWDHDADGEAEFWPAGDEPLVSGIFSGNVTAADLKALNDLLIALDGDFEGDMPRIQFAIHALGADLHSLTASELNNNRPRIFMCDTRIEVLKYAARELFEAHFPDLYKATKQDRDGILNFDWYKFIHLPKWITYELRFRDRNLLMVLPS